MATYHLYDLWSHVVAQTLATASQAIPVEDLYHLKSETEFDRFVGSLVTFRLTVYGKGVKLPSLWAKHPTSIIHARKRIGDHLFRVRMTLRTHYLFSDTAAINLSRGRVSGLGMLQGTVIDGQETEITLTPLFIGAGGIELNPENYRA